MEVLTECADERNEVGPNGGRIEVMENGDRVEWVTEEESLRCERPLLRVRGRESIVAKYRELQKTARRIHKKYGDKNHVWNDLEWDILCDRISILAWVLGSDWEPCFDRRL